MSEKKKKKDETVEVEVVENVFNTGIIKFNKTKSELEQLRDEALAVDKNDMEALGGMKKLLTKVINLVKKEGKSYRDDANAFNKSVLATEKEYVSIIEDVKNSISDRIVELENETIREARMILLPIRKKQLEAIAEFILPTDDFILGLDDKQFTEYYSNEMRLAEERVQAKADQEKRDEEFKKQAEANAKIKAEQDAKDLIEKTKADAQKKIDDAQAEVELKEKNRLAEIEAEKKAKEDEEKRIAEEKARLEADTKFQKFKTDNNFNPKTDKIKTEGDTSYLFRLIAVHKK